MTDCPDNDARQRLCALALETHGLTARDSAYLDLIAPADIEPDDHRRAEMAKMSGCALTICGLWRRFGIKHPLLERPYVTGHAVMNVVQIARDGDAWIPQHQLDVAAVREADVLLIDAPEHVLTVVAVIDNSGVVTFASVDGGQKTTGGVQTIQRRSRSYYPHLAAPPPGSGYAGPPGYLSSDGHSFRPLRGRVDFAALAASLGPEAT